jgi:zinc/manganese transport system substrate-binding protein
MRIILSSGPRVAAGCVLGIVLGLSACASSGRSARSVMTGGASCPTGRVSVVVTVAVWGDIVDRLAGACGRVTTIITSSSGDPHDYEPNPADSAAFADADLVVVNGLDYDAWADKAIAALDRQPDVVNAGEVAQLREGDNPHVWYGPKYVYAVADAVTAELEQLAPKSADVFERNRRAWEAAMRPYRAEIERIEPRATGKVYGATEGVFDYMADALGMRDATPRGYTRAAANEAEPAPGDLHELEQALEDRTMAVLFFNPQTEGAIPNQVRDTAESAGVPVVNVTESVPAEFDSFEAWQVSQLSDLAAALRA